jgi:glycosyltransferase involved in cell wall biosynthesis
MKKILLVTRPIVPPWDEASKNFAFYLAMNLDVFDFYLLTDGTLSNIPPHIHQKAIYTSNKFNYIQKLKLLKLRHVLREDFDVIHYMFTPTKINSFSFKTFVKHKKTKTIQTIATLREDLFKEEDFKNILFADLIITYSNYAKNKLNSIGFNNVKRIYPGIDIQLYSPAGKDKEIQKMLDVTDEDFVVDYPGEYVRLGATDDLVNLIIEYGEEFRKRKIKICFPGRMKGPEDYAKKNEVKKILQEKNMVDIVRFTDELKKNSIPGADFMSRRYNTSDLIIFPVQNMKGKFDIPLAVIEVMACAKPIIISNLPIFSEFANTENSVMIEKGNMKRLADAIFDLYDHREKREQIGKNARKFVENNFDIKKVAEKYKEIYEHL